MVKEEDEAVAAAAVAVVAAAPSKPLSWNEKQALKKAEEEKQKKLEAEAAEKARLAALAESSAASKAQSAARSFYDVISNDEDILKILVHIMHGTTNVAVDLGKLISHYDRYTPIFSTDKAAFIRRYANTKRPLASFDMDITRYKERPELSR